MKTKEEMIRDAINQLIIEIKHLAHGYQDTTHTTPSEYDELARSIKNKTDVIKDLAYTLAGENGKAARP
jgi:hypothetical protein